MRVLASDPVVLQAIELDKDLKLVEKLNRFSMVPADFAWWKQRRSEVVRWAQRGADLVGQARALRHVHEARSPQGGRRPGATDTETWPDISDVANRHAVFYRWAEARNRPLVKNLLARWADDRPAVLVAGGFHADGLRAVAQSEGVGYISLVPRVINTKQFPPPLESFRSNGKNKRWFLPGSHALQTRLQTVGMESRSIEPGQVPFVTGFIAMVYATLVMDPESRSSFSSQAVEKLREVARSRFGVDLVHENSAQEIGRLELTVRFLSAPEVPAYTVTINGVGPNGGASDLWVGIQPVPSWRQAVEFIRQADRAVSSLGPAVRLWAAGVLPQAIDQMGLAFQRTAVFLIPTVRTAGGSGLLQYFAGLKERWTQSILLAREREVVVRALSQPLDVRNARLAALAGNHTVVIPSPWIQSLTEAINGHKVGNPEVGRDKKSLLISLDQGEFTTHLRLHVTAARALYERPSDYSPYQLVRSPDGTIDVYLAEPVVSSPERLLPLVIGRMLREINGQPSGNHRMEELQILLGMWESLAQYSINSWASYISGLKLEPIVSIPAEDDRSQWTFGRSLDFIGRQGNLEVPPPMNNTSLFVLTGASPNSEAESLASTVTIDAVVKLLMGISWGEQRARGMAMRLVEDRLEGSIRLIEQFQELANQRGLLTRLSWRVNRQELATSGSNLVIGLLEHVGASQGQQAALAGTPYSSALETQMTEQFPYLAQTLLGIMKMAGQPLDRATVEKQRALLSDMWTVYAEHFSIGYGQLSSVYSPPAASAAVAQANGVSAGVFHLANPNDAGSLERLLDVLLSRGDLSLFRVALLLPGEAEKTKETVVRLLKGRLNNRTVSDADRSTVMTFLDANGLLAIEVGESNVHLDTVFGLISDQWDNVLHVDVFTHDASVFETTVATVLSWSLYENGVLISNSVKSALAERRIRAFIEKQA
ncbi:MAG: hypothetical protein IPN19_07305 [Elusimicrobia bacterium]|nr:hypothetical protein [Elusimicrobiota bacterium]